MPGFAMIWPRSGGGGTAGTVSLGVSVRPAFSIHAQPAKENLSALDVLHRLCDEEKQSSVRSAVDAGSNTEPAPSCPLAPSDDDGRTFQQADPMAPQLRPRVQ
jgi:hypothetical protein